MHHIARSAAAATASVALIATGLTTGVGVGVASADAECQASSHGTHKSTVGRTYTYEKSVDREAANGNTVTYTLTISTSGGIPIVRKIVDFPPPGFGAPISATFTHTDPKPQTANLSPSGGGYALNGSYTVKGNNPLILQTTYLVPEGIPVGTQVTSGGMDSSGTLGIGQNMPGVTACFTVRDANAGETVTGSLDDNGLGSSDGQLSSTGSIADILGDALSRALEGLLGNLS
ncbi:hypothetical protein BFN03_19285 [Rhodococcus sp. WMMA185]|uniref:hypothetical protein n=1 Tax=Rhodococcus sp. WMMA185 TaxID=679318 RepID=UPI0008782889|nr:hypothetical protein [Rhodococcus sp. WMMA185]AOW94095.1 hypothetical protein BFN03_19285 [Rhodococcus sp. WMMA185]